MRRAALVLALALWPALGHAATTINKGGWQGVAITTASQQIIGPASVLPVPVAGVGTFLYLENPSATGTVCIAFDTTATISGGACAAGEISLAPGAFRFFDVAVPASVINAIGSSAGSLTVGAQ